MVCKKGFWQFFRMLRWMTSLAVLLCAGMAQGAVLLWDAPGFVQGYSGVYSIDDDTNSVGIEIKCGLNWGNNSTPVPANNQISANGTFGSINSGLVEITTTDPTHAGRGETPTYTIHAKSFWIEYATGVVNNPGSIDSFTFHFNLGTTNLATAQAVVDELNACIAGSLDCHGSLYAL